ncbi:MAG TPA: response regulator [Acidimicrobiales bacterium]
MTDLVTATVVWAVARNPGLFDGVLERIARLHSGQLAEAPTDAVVALFRSATRALDAAVAMQQAAARVDAPPALRIGVSTGEVSLDESTVDGRTAAEAAGLCRLAADASIVAGPAVHLLAGARAGHALRSRGVVTIPDLGTTAEVFEVEWRDRQEPPLRVVVADDATVIREGVAALLRDAGLTVVATVGDADALLEAVATHEPDVVVTDIRMPPTHGLEGLEAAIAIRTQHPGVAVLVLSQYIETRSAIDLLANGSRGVGYLLKEHIGDVDELTRALRQLVGGGSVVDPEIVSRLLTRTRTEDPLEPLTDRERDVLRLMAQGRANPAIAASLGLTPRTVESHVRSIFAKLGLEPEPDDHRRVLAVLTFLRAQPTR